MQNKVKQFGDFLIFSNIFVALSFCCLAYETVVLLGINKQKTISAIVLLFFATLFIYSFHRNFRTASRTYHHKTFFSAGIIIASAGVAASLFFVNMKMIILMIPGVVLTLGYTVPFIPRKKKLFRLRDVPFIKAPLISFVISYITIALPMALYTKPVYCPDMILLFVQRFFFLLAIIIPFDIRDIETDKQYGLKTIPTALGAKKALFIAYGCMILHIITVTEHLYAFIISALFTALIISESREGRGKYFYSLLVEGTMIIQCVAIIIAAYFHL